MSALGTGEFSKPPTRSFNAFIEKWGDVSGFENFEQLNRLWSVAEQTFSVQNLPYHNFEHATGVLWKAMELADTWKENEAKDHWSDETPDRKALILAALFHDSGYGEDYQAKNCESAEAYSADIMTSAAQAEKLSEEDIYNARQLILATRPGVVLKKSDRLFINKKLMIRADIDNIGGDFASDFTQANLAILKEASMLAYRDGEVIDQHIFAANTIRILAHYIGQNLLLSPIWDRDHERWYIQARKNIKKYAAEQAPYNMDLSSFVRSIGSPLVDRVVLGTDRLKID